jgi:capsular exopolysaccharide synthesis family protein
MSYGYRYPTESGGASLSSIITFIHPYWVGLKRFWWIPAVLAGLAAGAMLLVIRKQPPPSYVSTARIWISFRSADPTGGGRGGADPDGTQIEVMNSPELRQRAENTVQAQNPALRVTPVRLYANKVKDTSIFSLQAHGMDPAYTKAFLETFIDTYLKYLRESFQSEGNKTIEAINRKMEEVSRELKEATKAMDDFLKENSLELLNQNSVSSAGTYAKLLQRQKDLELDLSRLELFSMEQVLDQDNRTATSSLLQAPARGGQATSGEVTDNPETRARLGAVDDPLTTIYTTRLRIQTMRNDIAELGKSLKPKHPRMIEYKDILAREEKNLDALVAQNKEKIEQRKQAIRLEMEALEEPIKQARKETAEFDKKMEEYKALKAAVDSRQPTYDLLLKAAEGITMRQGMADYTIKELDAPSNAVANEVDNTTKMIVAVVVGLTLGVGIVGLLVFFDDRVKSLTALKASFQEAVIGQVPNVGDSSESNTPIDLLRVDDDRHNFVESFRNIRSSILFMDTGEARPKTIVITSAIPSEGKSSVAANLAKTMASSGSKVLLVDGDQRRCSINVKMGLPVGPGFSDVLSGKMTFDEAVLNPEENLYVLVRGTTIKNPGEMFVGTAADTFLRSVYDRFDYILIDTPPVLAADDVTSLAPKVDGVVFVIRAEHTSARLAKQSLELLYNRHVRVLGLIYNRANLFLPEYSYYKYSSYYNQPEAKSSEPTAT